MKKILTILLILVSFAGISQTTRWMKLDSIRARTANVIIDSNVVIPSHLVIGGAGSLLNDTTVLFIDCDESTGIYLKSDNTGNTHNYGIFSKTEKATQNSIALIGSARGTFTPPTSAFDAGLYVDSKNTGRINYGMYVNLNSANAMNNIGAHLDIRNSGAGESIVLEVVDGGDNTGNYLYFTDSASVVIEDTLKANNGVIWQSGSVTFDTVITLPAFTILNSNTNPDTLLLAGPNETYQIVKMAAFLDYNSSGYTYGANGANISYSSALGSEIYQLTSIFLGSTADKIQYPAAQTRASGAGEAIVFYSPDGDPTAGDSPLKLHLTVIKRKLE